MIKPLPLLASLFCLLCSSVSAQEAGLNTLGSIAPELTNSIGFNNSSYATFIPNMEPPRLKSGARVEHFIAPDGKSVTVSVAAPVVNDVYQVPSIKPGENPAEYFANAIAQAGPHKTIVFPKGGVYNFLSGPRGPHLKISGLSDVVLDGNGSVLNFSDPRPGIAFSNITRVAMKNFTIDWPQLQISSLATIVASGGKGPRHFTYDLQIDPEFINAASPKTYKAIYSWDSKHGYWSLNHPDHGGGYNTGQAVTASGAAQNVPSFSHQLEPGEHVVIRHYTTEGDAIDIYRRQDVTLQNITIYSSPGFGIGVLDGSSGLVVADCKVTRASGRPISTAADALHINNCAGNMIIEGNLFAYQGDDGLNINAHLFPIASGGTNEISVPKKYGYLKAGDKVALFNSEMKLDTSHAWSIVSIQDLPGDETNKLILDQEIPVSVTGGYLVDLNFCGARYIVRNNQFFHNRARGVLLQTPYGLVEGNRFTGQSQFGIFLTTCPPEGPGAQDVVIASNTISEGGVNGGPSAIAVSREDHKHSHIYGNIADNPPVHQNIIFRDNEIKNVPGPGFYISSANNVVLLQNTLNNTNFRRIKNGWNSAGDLNYPIVINDASNILLRGNSIEATPSAINSVFIDNVTTSAIRLENNH
jgi:hypothetical protein